MNKIASSFGKALLYGFLIWLIPFAISFLTYPLKTSSPALFVSIMPVVVTLCVVFFLVLYFRKLKDNFLREGIAVGLIWFAISLVLDLLMFMWGPMKMTFVDYMMDVGIVYLIMPTVTIGIGYLMAKALPLRRAAE
jgi:hypothetical protein